MEAVMRLKSMLGFKSLAVLTGILLIFVSACSSAASNIAENIAVQDSYNLIQDNQNNSDFVILDIRTPQEYATGFIEDAVNIDYYATIFRDDIDKLDKDKTYLVYCRTANRSGQAMSTFNDLGFTDVYDMQGGIVAWQAAGYSVVAL